MRCLPSPEPGRHADRLVDVLGSQVRPTVGENRPRYGTRRPDPLGPRRQLRRHGAHHPVIQHRSAHAVGPASRPPPPTNRPTGRPADRPTDRPRKRCTTRYVAPRSHPTVSGVAAALPTGSRSQTSIRTHSGRHAGIKKDRGGTEQDVPLFSARCSPQLTAWNPDRSDYCAV